jgi:hypothetical protein
LQKQSVSDSFSGYHEQQQGNASTINYIRVYGYVGDGVRILRPVKMLHKINCIFAFFSKMFCPFLLKLSTFPFESLILLKKNGNFGQALKTFVYVLKQALTAPSVTTPGFKKPFRLFLTSIP